MSLFEKSYDTYVHNNTGLSNTELEQELKGSRVITITNIDRGYKTLHYSSKRRWIVEGAWERSDRWIQEWRVLGDEGAKHFFEEYVRLQERNERSPLPKLEESEAEQIRARAEDLFKVHRG